MLDPVADPKFVDGVSQYSKNNLKNIVRIRYKKNGIPWHLKAIRFKILDNFL